MSNEREGEVLIGSEGDIVDARKAVRGVSSQSGFGTTDVTRIVTAASELARNIYHYAGTGTMTWRTLENDGNRGVELIFKDNGPGIADIEQALQPGYSSRGGLGMGLPGTKRLMDEMEIESQTGKGTKIVVRKWLRRR
jgi:serine/threonine-protein kinase RsbT